MAGRRLVPRIAEIDQLNEYLPPPAPGGERRPILVRTGVDGIGKTTLLKLMAGALNRKTPWAFIDCAEYSPDEIPEILTEAKTQLNRYCPHIGRLWFPRLELGLAATRADIDFTDQREARRTLGDLMRRQLRARSRRIEEILGGMAGDVFASLKLGLPTAFLRVPVEYLTTLIASRILSSTSRRNQAQMWYGHHDQGHLEEPISELARLNRYSRASARTAERDEFLIEAFFADLRAAFGRGRLARHQWHNCVVLFDNLDTETGKALLHRLNRVRRHLQTAGVAAEPLLMVASSRTRFPDESLHQSPVSEFTESETELLSCFLPEGTDRRFPKLVHLFTGGYPAASALLVDLACVRPAAAEGGIGTVLATITESETSAAATVESRLLHLLVESLLKHSGNRPFPDSALEPLTTCAAARTFAEARWLAEKYKYADRALLDDEMLRNSGLWHTGELRDEDEHPSGAHRLLRRLLLRRLAGREAPDEPGWTELHEELRARCLGNGDLTGELYHALATDEVKYVARRLTESLSEPGEHGPWLDLLRSVAEAPQQIPGTGTRSPFEQQVHLVESMAGHPERNLIEVARLVTGLRIADDPCTGPERRQLHRQIAMDLRKVASDADRPADLHHEADRHGQQGRAWSR